MRCEQCQYHGTGRCAYDGLGMYCGTSVVGVQPAPSEKPAPDGEGRKMP